MDASKKSQGMYSTKYKVYHKADIGPLSIHTSANKAKTDVYGHSSKISNSRYEGKQFLVKNQLGAFSTAPYEVTGKKDAFMERNSYNGVERKLGFGSGCPPQRDEYSNTIAIQQFRETIKSELEKQKIMALKQLELNRTGDESLPVKTRQLESKEEFFEYDQVHSFKEDDDIGKPKRWEKLNTGSLRTTTSTLGRGCEIPSGGALHSRISQTKYFFDNSHLGIHR